MGNDTDTRVEPNTWKQKCCMFYWIKKQKIEPLCIHFSVCPTTETICNYTLQIGHLTGCYTSNYKHIFTQTECPEVFVFGSRTFISKYFLKLTHLKLGAEVTTVKSWKSLTTVKNDLKALSEIGCEVFIALLNDNGQKIYKMRQWTNRVQYTI